MSIQKLPQYVINRLKAGEIVERPVAVVKELVENALDAEATRIELSLQQGGKKQIHVSDDGEGIPADQLPLSVERYATSKITTDSDLDAIGSYGFRGEALASIAEVSSLTIQSRHHETKLPEGVGTQLWKEGEALKVKEIPFPGKQGTSIIVDTLFAGIPARKKFLKTDATERNHCKKMFISYCLVHRDKARKLKHNGEVVYDLPKHESMIERMSALYTPEREGKRKSFERADDSVHIYGVAGDASLHFSSQKYIHIFVNQRPVQDRLLKKALLDAYKRQIVPGMYPFVHLFVDISPDLVDVNVHPRKIEVKFLDPGSIFNRVHEVIKQQLGSEKVNYAAFNKKPIQHGNQPRRGQQHGKFSNKSTGMSEAQLASLKAWQQNAESDQDSNNGFTFPGSIQLDRKGDRGAIEKIAFANDHVQIVGQVWDSYIIAQGVDDLYYIDQHALAERIAFEKMRTDIKEHGFETELLLQPLTIGFPADASLAGLLDKLSEIGFDIALFGEKKLIIYAVPKVFVDWKLDIELLFQQVWALDELPDTPNELFDVMIDEMVGMKACKASIKAGESLSLLEMKQLLEDGMEYVDGLFVCQHGRPSVVRVERRFVDALFDR